MSEIFITSDLHFCHDKEFLYGPRGFNSIDEMNEAIVERWNSLVSAEDDVYILGDLILMNNKIGLELIRNLNGKLHIIIGNHDTDVRIKEYKKLENVVEVGFGARLRYKKWNFYLSHYPTKMNTYNPKEENLKKMVPNLCGHSHTQDMFQDAAGVYNKEKFEGIIPIFHIEMDTNNCYPWNIVDVIKKIESWDKEWKGKK